MADAGGGRPPGDRGLCTRGCAGAYGRNTVFVCSKVVALIGATCLGVASAMAFAEGSAAAASSGLDEGSRRGLIFPDYKEAFRIRSISATACGPLSLMTILKRMGMPLYEADIEKIIGTAGSKGTNLMQLKELAASYGVYALGVELTTEELKRTGMYAIAHVDWARFVAVTGYSQSGIEIVRPLKKAVVVSDERFSDVFTGRALLISRVPFPKEVVEGGAGKREVRGLRLSQSSIGIGRISSVDWEKSVFVYNDGREPMVLKVKPCCASISARLEPNVVAAGGSAVLTVAGKQKEPGQFEWSVSLLTNEEDVEPIKVPIQGYLEPPVFFETPAVKLTNVLENQKAEAHARFISMDGVRIEDLVVKVPEGAPVTVHIQQGSGGQPYLWLRWNGSGEGGWHRYRIRVGVGDANNVGSGLLFGVEVVPVVEVFPASVVIGESELGTAWSRRFVFKFNGQVDKNFGYEWTDERFADGIEVLNCADEKGEPVVVLSPKCSEGLKGVLGLWSDLVFRFDSGVSSSARLYAGKKAFLNGPEFVEEGKEASMK